MARQRSSGGGTQMWLLLVLVILATAVFLFLYLGARPDASVPTGKTVAATPAAASLPPCCLPPDAATVPDTLSLGSRTYPRPRA